MFLKHKVRGVIGEFENHQGDDWEEMIQEEICGNLLSKKIIEIKMEASRRILSAYPETVQMNYIAAVSEIHNKEIVAMKKIPFIAQYQLTNAELQIIKDAQKCKDDITAIRTKSNTLETSLNSMTLEQLKLFDPLNDLNWK